MTDDDDGDTGYKVCSLTPSAGSETYIEESGVTDGQLLGTWISDVGEAPAKLPRGMYDWFIFAEKTSGTKTLRLYWELYERKTDTSEVLIATSSESNELKTGEKTGYVVPLALDSDHTPDSGSRIVGKIYASVSGGGNAPTVKIYYQGASGSRWEIPSTTEILNNIYIKRDEIGIDDDDILQVDQAAGLTAGNLVRATSSGLEILAQLSGKAGSAFDWNGQNLDNISNITATSLTIGSYYLNSLVSNNKVPDSDKVDGYHLDQDVRTTASPSFVKLYTNDIRMPASKEVLYIGGYNILSWGVIKDNAVGFKSPYKVEKWDGSSWSDITSSDTWEYFFDCKLNTKINLINYSYSTNNSRIRLYIDLGNAYVTPAELLCLFFQHTYKIEYIKVDHSSTSDFSSDVETRKEVTSAIYIYGDNCVVVPTSVIWKRYLRIDIELSRQSGSSWELQLRQIIYLSAGYWSGGQLLSSWIPIDWDYQKNVFFDKNLGIGQTSFGTSAEKVLAIANGTAPASSPANSFQMYSADQAAGNACPHFRTENGKIIKLYQQAHITDADGTLADITTKFNTLLGKEVNHD